MQRVLLLKHGALATQGQTPSFGAVWLNFRISKDREQRTSLSTQGMKTFGL